MAINNQDIKRNTWNRSSSAGNEKKFDQTISAALAAFSLEKIAYLPPDSLLIMQRLLRNGSEFGFWSTPTEWQTPGTQNVLQKIDLGLRIWHFLDSNIRVHIDSVMLDEAIVELTRYLIILRVGPSGLGRSSFRPLSPSSVINLAFNYVPHIYAIALSKFHTLDEINKQKSRNRLLSLVSLSDIQKLPISAGRNIRKECERMRMLANLGLWRDAPSLDAPSLSVAMSSHGKSPNTPPTRDPHLPLPDDYVSALGSRTLWVVRELGPNLLELGSKFEKIWEVTNSEILAPVTIRDRRRNAVKDILESYSWISSSGQPLGVPPLPLQLAPQLGFHGDTETDDTLSDQDSGEVRWPPVNYRDFCHLLGTLQGAHLVTALLSIGARRSEILSLQCDCVIYASDSRPYIEGKTYKLVEQHNGELRDWLLPELAVDAIEQQSRLVRLFEKVGFLTPNRTSNTYPASPYLWRRISSSQALSDPYKPLGNINKLLVRYVTTIGLDVNPGGQRLRSHRFRKTLARLVGLALTQSPRLLMDVFGHKSLEMTLYYILTDKNLRTEIDTVSRELRVMRAKDVVEDMVSADLASATDSEVDYGGYGGMAAISIHAAVVKKQQETHRTGATWGARNAIELAELLTLQGTAWQQVRNGVLCTKLPGEAGPCNRSKGRPEPSNCSSRCEHRLEEAFLREDVEASLVAAVSGYEKATAEEDDMTAAHWAGQISANLTRFPSIQQKWSSHPIIRLIMTDESCT